MNKKDIGEIKKQFTPDNCTVTRLCGCYVDGEKNKLAQLKEAFLSLPEEEIFKYFEIFRKALSGTIGRNLMNMEFPLHTEDYGGTQEFLMRLRESRLTDDQLLDAFYDKVIASYDCAENYLILLIHAAYDIPGKSTDGLEMFDASDEVYEYLLCCICPVKLSKPGLAYNAQENCFQNRIRDWLVEMPDLGFLFPAFTERSTDIHSLLYYTKKPEELHDNLVDQLLGCVLPLSAGNQKETFHTLVETSLGEDCDFEVVKTIHEKLNELAEAKKDDPEPLALDKAEVKALLVQSGADQEKLTDFDAQYEACAGTDAPLMVSNVTNTRKFEIKTPDIVITVNPERADLIETKMIEGRRCLVIPVDDHVQLNGISVRTVPFGEDVSGGEAAGEEEF
ncbi:MAG: DUF4317 domain-containing protein [Eubacteriales bacterium]|nr:DUF4317 domain-containing protein [Eubacteriales bacterium]